MSGRTVVIGGGIVGASAAYHLARAGTETLLIDREDEGRATDAGAGILSPATSSRTGSEAWFEFATEAVGYYPDLAGRLEEEADRPTSYARTGLLAVAASEATVPTFEEALDRIRARQDRLGSPAPGSIEELDAAAARERFPPLADVERAFHYADAARIDGRVFAGALVDAGRSHGLATGDGDVTAVRIEDGAVAGVRTAEGRAVDAERVVVAGGAWSSSFADQLGVGIPVEPQRGQIAHLGVPDGGTESWPILRGVDDHYLVPWPDDRVAVGATREAGSGYAPRTTAAGVRDLLDTGLALAPGLADAALREVRVGLRPATPDGLPVLGAAPAVEGAFLATGHGPTGLRLGPYSGKAVAALARGEQPEADLSPFRVERFGNHG